MVKFWVNRIMQGKAAVEDVPEPWRDEVRALLSESRRSSASG